MGCYNLKEELSIRDVGEKAFHLSQMKRSGLPVPNGIVISDSVFKTRDLSSVKHQISSFVDVAGKTFIQQSSFSISLRMLYFMP